MQLSLIIPAYNEAKCIADTLQYCLDYFARQDYESEILVVDDASEDDTSGRVRDFAQQQHEGRVRLLRLEENIGKGGAVRAGMLDAGTRGAYRAYYDADASTAITDLERVWPKFQAGADIVAGSRALPQSEIVNRQPAYREMMGKSYNGILRLLRLTRLRDTQCGFKVFTREAAELVFSQQRVAHFAFDAELLYIAQQHGLQIAEVPVHWHNREESRVHPLRDSARMFGDVLRVRWHGWRGHYS